MREADFGEGQILFQQTLQAGLHQFRHFFRRIHALWPHKPFHVHMVDGDRYKIKARKMLARQRGNVVCRQLGFTAEEKGHAFALWQR